MDPELIKLKMDFESPSALFFIVKWERDVDVRKIAIRKAFHGRDSKPNL